MATPIKLLLCTADDGLMVTTIEQTLKSLDYDPTIVLVEDKTDTAKIQQEIVDADIVYPNKAKMPKETIELATQVKLFQYGTGYDTIDLAAAKQKGVAVCNMPGITAQSAAEQTLSLILDLAKQTSSYDSAMKQGAWERGVGVELARKTLGILGYGQIGRRVAKMAHGFDMNIIATRNNSKLGKEGNEYVDLVSYDKLLAQSDILSIHLPLVKSGPNQTKDLLTYDDLKRFGESGLGWLINVSRGAIVEESGLLKALQDGYIRKAGLDVYATEPLPADHPLRSLDNVTLTPHIAGDTTEALTRRYTLIATNADKVMKGQQPEYLVKELQ